MVLLVDNCRDTLNADLLRRAEHDINQLDADNECSKKMTYNEWRQLRKRRKLLYKAPTFQTRLQSLEVQEGYSVKLSVVIAGFPTPCVTWSLDDEELDESGKFMFEHDEKENKYSLLITQITKAQAGCYKVLAMNCEGTESSLGFISIKDTSRGRRKRSVSRRPLISTIKEWRSKEEPSDPKQDRLILKDRIFWDWSNLCASSSDDELHRSTGREQSCDLDFRESESKTAEEWEEARRKTQITSTRCKSLPNMNEAVVENKYAKLKSFWEQTTRKARS